MHFCLRNLAEQIRYFVGQSAGHIFTFDEISKAPFSILWFVEIDRFRKAKLLGGVFGTRSDLASEVGIQIPVCKCFKVTSPISDSEI